ncbi:MAG: TolC family protein, partial [Aquabacterium sp.]
MSRPSRLAGLLLAVAAAALGGDGWAQVVSPGSAPAWPLATDPQSVQVLRLVDGQADGAGSPSLSSEQWRAILLSAVDRHPEARGAEHATAAAGAALRETQAAALPQLDLRADAGHRRNDPSTLLDTPFRRFDSAGLALSLRQLVYDFGAVQAATDGGRARESALAARADQRRLDLGLRVVAAWVDLVRVRQQQALMALNVAARQASVDDLDQRYRLGAGLASDIWRAQARLADAKAAQARAQARLAGAEAAWRELLGELPAQVTWPPMPAVAATTVPGVPGVAPDFPALRSAEAALRA